MIIRISSSIVRLLGLAFMLLAGIYGARAQEVPVLQWIKSTQGGPNDYERADVTASTIDAFGNILITGSYDYQADFDPGPGVFNLTPVGNNDAFILKLDGDGNFLWAVSFGENHNQKGLDVETDAAGNVYVTGDFDQYTFDVDPGPGVVNVTQTSRDVVVLKLDPNGNFLNVIQVGGGATDYGDNLEVDAGGNIYVAGFFGGTVDFDPGPGFHNVGGAGTFLLKLTAAGAYDWVITTTYTSLNGNGLAIDAAGDLVFSRTFNDPITFSTTSGPVTLTAAGSSDILVAKFHPDGSGVWAKSFGGTGTDQGYGIAVDAAKSVYLTGNFYNTADFDPGAGTYPLNAGSVLGAFVSKLDANGNFVYAKLIGGTNDVWPFSIAIDASQNVYTTRRFRGTIDFDPGAGVYNLTPIGPLDAYVSKFNAAGDFVWVARMGGPGSGAEPAGYSINAAPSGTLYTVGTYRSTIDFDPGPCSNNTVGDGGYDIFIQTLTIGTPLPVPTFTSFSPTSGPIGTPVTLMGTNFSTVPAENGVSFFNNKTATVSASTTTSINTTVPAGTTTGKISVTAYCVTVQSAANFTVSALPGPTITSFSPVSGPVGTVVTIIGTNFSATPASNTVKFNGTTALVTASSTTSITTAVPTGASTGKITVTVTAGTATSAANFTVTNSGTITVTTQPSDVAACGGSSAQFTTAASGTTGITYKWQLDITGTGDFLDIDDIADNGGYSGHATATLIVDTSGDFGAGFYRCKIDGSSASTVFTDVVQLTISGPCAQPPIIETEKLATEAGGVIVIDLVPLITVPNDNLDINSIQIIVPPASGVSASVTNGILTINYADFAFTGTEQITLQVCDFDGNCATQDFEIEVTGEIVVYNAVSPAGSNPTLFIRYIDVIPETQTNVITIFDRWQNQVWKGNNYDNATVVFRGVSASGNELPTGTYYYRIEFASGKAPKTGFISLKR